MRVRNKLKLPSFWLQQCKQQKQDIFQQIFNLTGEIFREQPGRQTLRFIKDSQAYFLKRHTRPSLKEIFKNLIQARLPIWGAQNEVAAITRLEPFRFVPELVGYGFHQALSFIITKELKPTISLEVFSTPFCPPLSLKLKWALIRKIAEIAKITHACGINHRDFYLCHFLLDMTAGYENLDPKHLTLYVIDWHRAQLRQKVPFRWRVKDIAALYFSALNIKLTQRDLYRFMKSYDPKGKSHLFWHCVNYRAHRLYRKENRHVRRQKNCYGNP